MDIDIAITNYHLAGLEKPEILLYLKQELNLTWSLSKLKRRMKKIGLYRRKNFSGIEQVAEFIEKELRTSNKHSGYRWMHKTLITNGFVVKRETVRILLKVIDPAGVEERSRRRLRRRTYTSRGPNYIWHLDGNDKLRHFGVFTHSCIDGYSRYLLWLKAASTNKDAKTVAAFYVDTVENLKGFPLTVRADRGTENGTIEILQKSLCRKYSDSDRPNFLYGKSTHNQKIESWWLMLRNHFTEFYIDLFKQLEHDGYFEGSSLDKALIQFCFLPLIQKELDKLRLHWNTHVIRKQKNSQLPSGKPCNLFFMAERFGGEDQMVVVTDEQDFDDLRDSCFYPVYLCSEDVYEICVRIMTDKNLQLPKDSYSALNLYTCLREEVLTLMH